MCAGYCGKAQVKRTCELRRGVWTPARHVGGPLFTNDYGKPRLVEFVVIACGYYQFVLVGLRILNLTGAEVPGF